MSRPSVLLLAASLVSPHLLADEASSSEPMSNKESMLVTATRHPLAVNEVGSTVIILTRQDLELSGAQSVQQALAGLPGLNLRRNGGLGANTEIMIRGDKGGHTLIMIDGVEQSDSASIEKNFDIGDWPLHDVERIEIVKGPHSVAYGGSGLSGVINIITRRPEEKFEGSVGLELGSYETYGLKARVAGKQGSFSYHTQASSLQSAGFSHTGRRDEDEADGYNRKDLSLGFGYQNEGLYDAQLLFKGAQSQAHVDAGANSDDPNYRSKRLDWSAQLNQTLKYADHFETRLLTAVQSNDRRYIDDPDPLNPERDQTSTRSRYRGERRNIELSQSIALAETHNLSLAAQWLRDQAQIQDHSEFQGSAFDSDFPLKTLEERSFSLQYQGSLTKRFSYQVGARNLQSGTFKAQTVGQSALRFELVPEATSLRVNYGRGYRTPSLYQLFDPTVGEKSLQPEAVVSGEISLEQRFTPQLKASVNAFQNETSQLIEYNFDTNRYYNIARASFKGQEYQIFWDINNAWRTEAQYTQLVSLDRLTKEPLPSRPDSLWATNLTWKNEAWSWRTSLHGQSRSRAQAFLAASEGYRLVDTSLAWTQGAQRYSVQITNLGNTNYQQVAGYNSPGRSILTGAEVHF